MSDVHAWTAPLIALAVLAGSARTLWSAWRRAPRPRAWRVAALVLLQLASAVLLYRALFPPSVLARGETLVVATARAPADLASTLAAHEHLVALPEAGATGSATGSAAASAIAATERVPDLATALRRHPETTRLRIAGLGLTARDRDSVQGLPFDFDAAPLPRGFVALPASLRVPAGADFQVNGRVHGVRNGRVELLDPSGQRVDAQAIASDGRFVATGAVRSPGFAEFRVRLIDARGETVADAPLPVDVFAPPPLRVLLLAGAPDAELKYLRRWALDSGAKTTAQIQAGAGMQLGDAPMALNATTLKNVDVAIADARAWDTLGDARRGAVLDAVRNGMGLLLRVDGAPSAALRTAFSASGLRLTGAAMPAAFKLPVRQDGEFAALRLGPGSVDAPTAIATAELPELSRQSPDIQARDAQVWLRDERGRALAAWRPLGRGRIAAWLPMDTFQLVLVGRDDVHARLWSDALAEVARPAAAPTLVPPAEARLGERATLCGVADGANVAAPGAHPTVVWMDPATGPARCAAYWPRVAGWHTLSSGKASAAFYVRDPQALPGVEAQATHDATQRLALQPPRAVLASARAPGPRWPWFLAWLFVSAAMWWLERSRLGRTQPA